MKEHTVELILGVKANDNAGAESIAQRAAAHLREMPTKQDDAAITSVVVAEIRGDSPEEEGENDDYVYVHRYSSDPPPGWREGRLE